VSFVLNDAYGQTCIFLGTGDGASWSDGNNWSCGSQPSVTDIIVIPIGMNVTHNADINYTGTNITIYGSLDLGDKKLKLKGASSTLTIASTGSLTAKELAFESSSVGTIESGATVVVKDFKTKNTSTVDIDAACITVTNKVENKDAASMTSSSGSGCIDFTGTNYTNSSSGGIFGCTSATQADCFSAGGSGSSDKIFNGSTGTSWNTAANWTPSGVPDPTTENVTIPEGLTVVYDKNGNLEFKNATVFTICGTIITGEAHLHMKDNSHIELCPTAVFSGHEIKLQDQATGNIPDGAAVEVEQIEVKGTGVFTIDACVTVTEELKNKDDGTILGGGCIDYQGPDNKFENSGTGGIFNCVEVNVGDCELGPSLLPVEMTSFEAEIVNNEIIVNWETLSEINNSHFEVWLGSDIGGFNLVKTVDGAGSSSEIIEYSTSFKPELSGVMYVRLRQVDFNGDYVDSRVLALNYSPDYSIEAITLYPNPSRNSIGFTNLKNEEDYQVSIYSIAGDLINSASINAMANKIDISKIESGSYIVRVSDSLLNQSSVRLFKI
tara:strand:- start:1910 stop:3562 length:1653 start_codon:yes stop_codon:yes gene_type:complete